MKTRFVRVPPPRRALMSRPASPRASIRASIRVFDRASNRVYGPAARLVVGLFVVSTVVLAVGCAPSSGGEPGARPSASTEATGVAAGAATGAPSGAAAGSASAAAPSPSSGAASAPEPISLRFTVRDGRSEPPPSRREVAKGQLVEISLVSPSDHVEMHVHGYDLKAEAGPGATAVVRFVADRTGSFEVEAHPDTLLVQLAVR